MIVKVCGMTQPENISQVADLGVDMVGFNFHQANPRCIKNLSSLAGTIPDTANEDVLTSLGRKNVKKVGVFKDEMPQTVITQVYNYGLDYVELRGDASGTYVDNLRRTLVPDIAPKVKIMKTIVLGSAKDLLRASEYEGKVDMMVFLRREKRRNADGKDSFFDWVEDYKGETPFLVSGGIDMDDVEDILNVENKNFAGVNLNARFEVSVGVKDVEKLRKVMYMLKNKR